MTTRPTEPQPLPSHTMCFKSLTHYDLTFQCFFLEFFASKPTRSYLLKFFTLIKQYLFQFLINCLPPKILTPQDSAYTLYDRDFLSNLGSVLLFAVVGTLFNTFVIGYGLYGAATLGLMGSFPNGTELNSIESLIFSSLISAVDPVRQKPKY